MVGIALSLLESTGTSTKDFLRLLKNVGPLVVAIFTKDKIKIDSGGSWVSGGRGC